MIVRSVKNKSGTVKLNYILIAIIVCVILYLNICQIVVNMDTDYIAELNYGRNVCEHKSIFPKGWVYANELMFFSPALLFSMFYALTGQYIISYSVALCVSLFFILAAFVYFISGFIKSENNILLSVIFLLSFCGNGRSFAVLTYLYYGYYAWYLIVILFTVGYLERLYVYKKRNIWITFVIVTASFLLGIVGIRMAFFLYLPVLIHAILHVLKHRFQKELIKWQYINVCFLLSVCYTIGFFTNKVLLSDLELASDIIGNLYITDIISVPQKVWTEIVSALSIVIGNVSLCPVFSLETADMAVKGLLVIVSLGIIMKERETLFHSFVPGYFVNYFLIILIINSFTSYGQGRAFYYFLMPVFFISIFINYLEKNNETRKSIYLTGLIYLIFVNNFLLYYNGDIKGKPYDHDLVKLVEWIEDNQYKKITAPFWTAGRIEAYADGRIIASYLESELTSNINAMIYLNHKENYRMDDKDNIVILTDKEEEKIIENVNSKLYTRDAEKVTEIGEYNVYQFTESPACIFELPKVGMVKEYSPGVFELFNADFEENGSACSDGEEGFFITGPYADIVEGTYTVTFHYQIVDHNSQNMHAGYADISVDSGERVLKTVPILVNNSDGKAVIDDVRLDHERNVEFRIYAYKGTHIRVTNIEIAREE